MCDGYTCVKIRVGNVCFHLHISVKKCVNQRIKIKIFWFDCTSEL